MDNFEERKKVIVREIGEGFSQLSNAEVLEFTEDRIVANYNPDEAHCNTYGFLHGGAIYTAADTIGGTLAAAKSRVVTLDSNAYFMHRIYPKQAKIEGKVLRRGRRVITVSVEIFQDDKICFKALFNFMTVKDK